MKDETVSQLLGAISGLVERLSVEEGERANSAQRGAKFKGDLHVEYYTRLVNAWKWHIIFSLLICGGLVYYLSSTATPIYRATSTWRVDAARGPSIQMSDLMLGERTAQTYARMMTYKPVLAKVASQLKQDAADFSSAVTKVAVSPIRDTQLLNVVIEGVDPELIYSTANTLPEIFRKQLAVEQSSRFAESKSSLQMQMNSISQETERLQRAMEELEKPDTAAEELEVARLQNSLSLYQSQFANLLSRFEEIRLEESLTLDTIIMVNPAELPSRPVRPRILINTLLAALAGAAAALGFGFLYEYLDNRIKSPREVKQLTRTACLGAVADISSGRHSWNHHDGLIALHSPRHPITEAYRGIRTNLQFANVDRKFHSLLITSALPGEGKTTTAANLAMVLAQTGLSVAVVDADLRKPTLHKIFRIAQRPGLVDGLMQEDDRIPYTPASNNANLLITPSGQRPPNPAELLGSQRMKQLFTALHNQVDVMIVDAPPLMAVADAQILAALVDGIVLVVSRGTPRQALARSMESLRQVDANLLGFVMNRMNRGDGEDYYYYYNYYYDEPQEPVIPSETLQIAQHHNGSNGVAHVDR